MKSRSLTAILAALAAQPLLASALDLNVTSLTGGTIESDWTAVYYSDTQPVLLGNDGGTSTGGFHAFDLNANTPIPALNSVAVGRTKVVNAVYNVGCKGKDYALTIAQPDSIIRVFELPGLVEREDARITALGDWSALCSWKSDAGNQYTFLFGKKQGIQFLVRDKKKSVELVEVRQTSRHLAAYSLSTLD
jgi:3-phytase